MIAKFKKKIKVKNSIIKGVMLLIGGTVSAQLLNTVLTPVITRIYTPEEFGVLTLYLSVLSLVGFGALEYEKAIPIAKNNKNAINIFYLSLIILMFFFSAVSILLFIFKNEILILLNIPNQSFFIFILSLGVLFSGLYKIFTNWGFRERNYKIVSRTKISQSFLGNLSTIILGVLGYGIIGLLIGSLMKTTFGIFSLSSMVFKKSTDFKSSFSIIKIKKLASEYRNFPIYSAPAEFFKKITEQSPILLITVIFGNTVTGFFGLAYTIVNLPTTIIGNAISDVFFSEASNLGKSKAKEIKKLSINFFKKLILFGIGPFILLIIFGPSLFKLFFGESWYIAGEYSRALSISAFALLIFNPATKIYEIFNKQKYRMYFDLSKAIIILGTFITSYILDLSATTTMYIYSSLISLIYFSSYIKANSILNENIKTKGVFLND